MYTEYEKALMKDTQSVTQHKLVHIKITLKLHEAHTECALNPPLPDTEPHFGILSGRNVCRH